MSLLCTLGLLEALWNADQPCTSVQVYAADCADAVLLELRKHLPKYYGVWSPPTAPNGNAFSVYLGAWFTTLALSFPTLTERNSLAPSLFVTIPLNDGCVTH